MSQYLTTPTGGSGEFFPDYIQGNAAIADTTSTAVIAAKAGKRFVCMNLIVSNNDATVTTKVTIEDSGGTDILSISCGALGGGAAIGGGYFPVFEGPVGLAVHAKPLTDSSETEVFMSGYYSGNME